MTDHRPARRRALITACAIAACGLPALSPTLARAQDPYPSKPIRIIVPFGPGGSPDVFARLVAKELGDRTKQTVIIENRPGANSMLGTSYVAKGAPADGYTILYGTNSGLSAARSMVKSLSYNPTADLSGVAMIGETSFMLLTRADKTKVTLPELIKRIRAQPDKYEIGGASVTTTVTNRMMSNAGQLKHVYVPYKENSRMLTELMAGQISAGFSPIPSAVPLIETGKLQPIAITGSHRVALFPDVPTLSEALPGVALSTWTGFFVASKTPRPIVDYLHKTLSEIVELPELKKYTLESGRPIRMTPAQIDEFVRKDEPRWSELFRSAGIEPE